MRRADRLFEILQLLRGGRLRTARELAALLEVSTRTVWRDVAALQAQGVPIDGERGVGYVLRDDFFLPPLALNREEAEALMWGTNLVVAFGDFGLAQAARELQIKIAAVSSGRQALAPHGLTAMASDTAVAAQPFLMTVRNAIRDRRKLAVIYCDLEGRETHRVVRPLNLEFWGQVWTLTTWCEAREDFRVFRCDRFKECRNHDERFRNEPGRRYADFLTQMLEVKSRAE